jgi:serine/threonine-protein kinase
MSFPGRTGKYDSYLPAGTELNGTFAIDSPLASGGMGEIYRGHEIQTGDPVAIKFIRGDMADDEAALALFRKEASALSRLHHEAIVRYLVFSVDPMLRRHYLAMEFVEGESLSDILGRGPLGFDDALALTRRIASGLQAAHDREVVHRDVSPDNVLVKDLDMARARIIDFGIARSTRAGDMTVIGGGFAGKYNYISPEQLGMFGGEVTGKSDIYSLGLVFAQCLRGKPIDMSGSQVDIIQKRQTVPDLSDIDARARPLLEWMLQPDPKDRPARMGDVATWEPAAKVAKAAEKTIIVPRGGRPANVSQPAAVPAERPQAAPRASASAVSETPRKPIPLPILVAAAVVILGGGGFVAWLQLSATPPRLVQIPAASLGPPTPPSPSPDASANSAPQSSGDTSAGSVDAGGAGTPAQSVPPHAAVSQQPNGSNSRAGPSSDGPDTNVALGPSPPSIVSPPSSTIDNALVSRFVHAFDGGDCFFSSPLSVSAQSAHIDGFGVEEASFQKMNDAFKRTFGVDPDIDFNQVDRSQCPALAYANSLPSNSDIGPIVTIENRSVQNNSGLSGTFSTKAPYVRLLIIDERGRVNSSNVKMDSNSPQETFNIKLGRPGGSAFPLKYLFMAIASTQPMSSPQLDGSLSARDFFDRFKTEASKQPAPPAATIKYFNLVQ